MKLGRWAESVSFALLRWGASNGSDWARSARCNLCCIWQIFAQALELRQTPHSRLQGGKLRLTVALSHFRESELPAKGNREELALIKIHRDRKASRGQIELLIGISIGTLQRNIGPAKVRYTKGWTEGIALKISAFSLTCAHWHIHFSLHFEDFPISTHTPHLTFDSSLPKPLYTEPFWSAPFNMQPVICPHGLPAAVLCSLFPKLPPTGTQAKPQASSKALPSGFWHLSPSCWIFYNMYSQLM